MEVNKFSLNRLETISLLTTNKQVSIRSITNTVLGINHWLTISHVEHSKLCIEWIQ